MLSSVLGEEDVKLALLKCLEMRGWREIFTCSNGLVVSEGIVCKEVINCTNVIHLNTLDNT
jgi:hypothetical protein